LSNAVATQSPKLSVQQRIDELWSLRFHDPLALVARATSLIESEHALEAFGFLQLAWGYRYRGENTEAVVALARAEMLYRQQRDDRGLANCCDLQATLLAAQNDRAQALALLHTNLALPAGTRLPVERMITHDRCGFVHDLLGDRDESLRQRYAALDAARASNTPSAIAFALGMLGGVHADLYNLEDADQMCRDALALVEPEMAMQAWSLVALNHMNALLAMDRGAEAARHAERLLALETRLNQRAAEQRYIVYADAFASTGDAERAQLLLDQSVRLRSDKQQSLISFTSAQIRVWNAQRKPALARSLAQSYVNDPQNGSDPAQVPSELLRILQGAAAACEALGDFAEALAFQKQAFTVHESLVGRSARARRLTLEIQHRIDRERWEREEAQRRQAAAEVEGRRLGELNAQLDVALRTRTRFLAAASHDLRQPAHALALYATALEHETSRAALIETSKRMRATVGSLSNMFDGLLELARLDADAITPKQEIVDLNELLTRLCNEYGDRMQGVGALLKFRAHRTLRYVQSDAVLIERILRNLIGNAVKYAGDGTVLVALRARSRGIAIEVRDAGPGMSVEEQQHVFDEFFRAQSASAKRDGLGLGLSIVERFARLLEMKVHLRSAVGRGSTFTLLIPQNRLAESVEHRVAHAATVRTVTSRRIFVIDDDADACTAMSLVLTQWGHACIATETAADAIHHATETSFVPDAVICDFQLRDHTAVVDVQALRERYGESLPILIISGSPEAPVALCNAAAGLSYLSKPVRPLRLKSWLAALDAV
jgi:signal transduction histidine kinase